MSVAKVIEISSESTESFEDAVRQGIKVASGSVRNIKGAWIKEQSVKIADEKIVCFRVDMKVTFILE